MLQIHQRAFRVHSHTNRIKPHDLSCWRAVPWVMKPCVRNLAQPCQLTRRQRRKRTLPNRCSRCSHLRLDLNENERAPIERDQIDLAVRRAIIANENGETTSPKMPEREPLTKAAQGTKPTVPSPIVLPFPAAHT